MKKFVTIGITAMTLLMPFFVFASNQGGERIRAEVTEVVMEQDKETSTFEGRSLKGKTQEIKVKMIGGSHDGQSATITNDFFMLSVGDKLFVHRMEDESGRISYQFEAPDRRGALLGIFVAFVLVVLVFGGKEGVRALVSLGGSLFAIGAILIPELLSGAPPVFLSSVAALGILILAILLTHGVNRVSLVAILGTGGTVILASIIAAWGVDAAHLSGITDDVSVYLNLEKGGALDFKGLLLGGIIIGMLGALTESAITQVLVVQELFAAGVTINHVYMRAMKVGRAHVGALVNTLALAYVGTGLPLLLYFYGTDSVSVVANNEIFATEIVRTMIGSIAVVFAVPLTTVLAIYFMRDTPKGAHMAEEGHSHLGHEHN